MHGHGGQVYLDGANLNAQVGLSRPGDYGADVSHLNLHKTFCIPHGGGGPGMGPIGVKAHLAPYPAGTSRDRRRDAAGRTGVGGAVRLGVDPDHLLHLHSDDGRRRPDARHRNRDPQRQLHRRHGSIRISRCCTGMPRAASRMNASSIRGRLKTSSGVTVDDIAKRLIDYGFHAPTMSFPVPGTLMIEPTESESKAELDRFCDAMIAIRQRDRRDRSRPLEGRGLAAAPRAAHRARHRRRCVGARLYPRRGLLPGGHLADRTNTGARSGGSTTSMATATWCARVRRSRTTRRRRSEAWPQAARRTNRRSSIGSDVLSHSAIAPHSFSGRASQRSVKIAINGRSRGYHQQDKNHQD